MGTGTKSVTHTSMGMGISIFSNRRYVDDDYSTLSIPYPLSSLIIMNTITNLEPKATCVVQCNEGTFFEKKI
jgi:hypothetical protein